MTNFTDSKLWKEYIESGQTKETELVFHACKTSEFAKELTQNFKNLIITAPDQNLISDNNEEKGPYKYSSEKVGYYFIKGYWNTYKNESLIRSTSTDSPAPILIENGREIPNDLPRKTNASRQEL